METEYYQGTSCTHETLRFGEMRALPQVSPQSPDQRLKELEQDGIIRRTDFYENPPHGV